MKFDKDNVCILIPTLNEEPTVGSVINQFKEIGYNNILVIDGKSSDNTRNLALEAGAKVILQKGKGKGNALIQAISLIQSDYVMLIDGDGTCSPSNADEMMDLLLSGYDQVIGNRLVPDNYHSFNRLNLTGDIILNYLFKVAHGKYLVDILSGYRVFTAKSLHEMKLFEQGFGIETEISSETVRNHHKVAVIPIKYGVRTGTPAKLNPIHDGYKIGRTIYRLAKHNNPLFYFGFIGAILIVIGLGVGVFIVLEWLKNIDHLPLTILMIMLVIIGLQVFMFGIQSDMQLVYQRELLLEIKELKNNKDEKD